MPEEKSPSSGASAGFRFKEYTSSLFVRLLFSFLIVIALLVSFILYSVVFYRGSVKDEIIKYNTLNLQKTTENYENLIATIRSSVLTFSLELQEDPGQRVNYLNAISTMQKLQLVLSNRSLYLDNIVLLYEKTGFALEKSRGADIDVMFERYYNSPDYDPAFWNRQFGEPFKFRVLPASLFAESDAKNRSDERTLLPIIVKNEQLSNFYMIAMADADSIYAELHRSNSGNFYILDESNRPLYASPRSGPSSFPPFAEPSGYVVKDNVYYFYMKGANGLTYLNVVPDTTISSQVRWNFSFVLLLVLTVAISVAASFLLSARLNSPVKRIIEAIQRWNAPMPWDSGGIKEFDVIHDKISDILKSSRDIRQDISDKESLLRYYAYSNALKNIRHDQGGGTSWLPADRPFVLLLFRVEYKPMLRQVEVEEDRATSFIREYIGRIIAQSYADSLTFQMEKDQILSIVFTEPDDPGVGRTLEQIRRMLDAEREYCFLTIAASGGTDDWNEAYEIGLEKLKRRTFNDETQLIAETVEQDEELLLSPSQEAELDANLYGGNDAFVLQLVRRVLGKMKKRDQSAQGVLQFAESIILRTQKSLQQRHLDPAPARHALAELPKCHTYEQLDALLASMIRHASLLVREVKEKRDHIIQFVYDYLENNYDKDITLDLVADKLNISRSYLSSYFKEKTGTYFVDYVNSVRIEQAKKLLLKPDIRIQDAALSVGYQNINSFNRMFKKFTGVTPSEFRKDKLV
ncbi:helix-turn-helix domain-containing protein [Paenibacillus flagellatus]|uniref:HTH araC/xylS-type domain-containing protein n=1 Tax=Paenibacillus flagellatus TaxID=2211139 RepID=A0A2V5KEB5_9BACL|nr:AraC family transcriptional regulator [Paenibacillus flagellatus]PYI57412.1 hypothetical protein DLM86_02950 [Paenibacillus flagellatus]